MKIEGGDFSGLAFDDLSLDKGWAENVILNQMKLKELSTIDSIFLKCSLAGAEIEMSYLRRTEFKSSRLQGIHLAESRVIDTSFLASKLNTANFRFAKLKNVFFDSCDMAEVDFTGTELKNVVFIECNVTFIDKS